MTDLLFILPAIIGSLLLILAIGLTFYYKFKKPKNSITKIRNDKKDNKKLYKKLKILNFQKWPNNTSGIVLSSGYKRGNVIDNNFVIKNLDKDNEKKLKKIPLTKLAIVKSLKRSGIVIAPTGSGKTQALLLPTIIYNAYSKDKPNMVITDPKGEIFDLTSEILKLNNYEVIKISTINKILDNHTYETDFWNPLENIIFYHKKLLATNEELEIQEYNSIISSEIDFLIETLASKKNNTKNNTDDDYWSENALSCLKFAVTLMLLKVELGEWDYSKVNFANLFKNVNNFANTFNDLLNFTKAIKSNNFSSDFKTIVILDYYIGWYSDHDDNLRSFINNATTALNVFATTYFQLLTSKSTFNIDQIILNNKPFVIFFTSNILGSSSTAENKLLKTYLELLYKKIDYYKNQVEAVSQRTIWWLLDEIGNLDKLKFLESITTAGRGLNQFTLPIFQSMTQIANKYSDTLLDNCEYKILFNNSNTQMAKQIKDQEGFEEKELPSQNIIKVDNINASDINNIESGYIGLWTFKKGKKQKVFYTLPITYFYMINLKYTDRKISKINSAYNLSNYVENINFIALKNSLEIQRKKKHNLNEQKTNKFIMDETAIVETAIVEPKIISQEIKNELKHENDLNDLKIDFNKFNMTDADIYIAQGKLISINKIFNQLKTQKTIDIEDKRFKKLKYLYYEFQVFMSNFSEEKVILKDLNYFIQIAEMTGGNEFYEKKTI